MSDAESQGKAESRRHRQTWARSSAAASGNNQKTLDAMLVLLSRDLKLLNAKRQGVVDDRLVNNGQLTCWNTYRTSAEKWQLNKGATVKYNSQWCDGLLINPALRTRKGKKRKCSMYHPNFAKNKKKNDVFYRQRGHCVTDGGAEVRFGRIWGKSTITLLRSRASFFGKG